jgi:alkylhydroperoxidase family enzyme
MGDREVDKVEALLDAIEAHGGAQEPIALEEITAKDRALLDYALILTRDPGALTRAHVEALRAAGCDDGEILDANQVTAYFAYANRVIDGLGVELEDHHKGS